MHIDVWADVTCPWCYLGVRHLRGALASFPYADRVEVALHAYFLDPELDVRWEKSHAHYMTNRRGWDFQELQATYERLDKLGRAEGIVFDWDRTVVAPTSNAFRLIAAAREEDLYRDHTTGADTLHFKVWEAIARAHLEMGLDISHPEVLVGCAQDVGMDPHDALSALADEEYAAQAFSDYQIAVQMGIESVPTFLIHQQFVVQGAQPVTAMTNMLTTAWNTTHEGDPR